MENRLRLLVDIVIDAASVSQPFLPADVALIAAIVGAIVWFGRWTVRSVASVKRDAECGESRVAYAEYVERHVPQALHTDAFAAFERADEETRLIEEEVE